MFYEGFGRDAAFTAAGAVIGAGGMYLYTRKTLKKGRQAEKAAAKLKKAAKKARKAQNG